MWKAVMTRHRKPLDELINNVEADMLTHDPESLEYMTLLHHLERLRKLKADNKPKRFDRNTVLLVAGNLLGIVVIVVCEQTQVLSQKGLREVLKPSNYIH